MGTIEGTDAGRLTEIEDRYRKLAAELADIGFVTRGSVVAATTTCSSRGCHCHVDPARRHGPYWQWSRSVGGMTRTRRLTEAEARRYQQWIANRRTAEAILGELEELSAVAARSLFAGPLEEAPRAGPRRPGRRAI